MFSVFSTRISLLLSNYKRSSVLQSNVRVYMRPTHFKRVTNPAYFHNRKPLTDSFDFFSFGTLTNRDYLTTICASVTSQYLDGNGTIHFEEFVICNRTEIIRVSRCPKCIVFDDTRSPSFLSEQRSVMLFSCSDVARKENPEYEHILVQRLNFCLVQSRQ